MLAGSACSIASAKNSSNDGMNSLKERPQFKIINVGCIYKKPNVNSFQDFSNLLSDLQASMLS